MATFDSNTSGANNSITGGNQSLGGGSEPSIVGTNNTVKIDSSGDGKAFEGSEPFLVGTNNTVNLDSSGDGKASGGSEPVVGTNKTSEPGSPDDSNAPKNDENYKWDFKGKEDQLTGGEDKAMGGEDKPMATGDDKLLAGGSGNPFGGDDSGKYQWDFTGDAEASSEDKLFAQSPWGTLKEVGITNFEQVFGGSGSGDMSGDKGGSGSEGNPFGGNPMDSGSGSAIAGGGDSPFGGSGGSPM